ncbi:MAG: LuxR C-terminal-related transcriptional regulator [Gemmatimonadota bacterium]
MMTRLFLITDIRLYREGLASLLARRPGLVVVGTAASGAEGVQGVSASRPDVVLVDGALANARSLVEQLNALADPPKVVALAVGDNEGDVIASAEAGIAGFVPRDGSVDDLAKAIDTAYRGEFVCTPKLAGTLLRRLRTLAQRSWRSVALPPLTARELEIGRLINRGLSNKEIARDLGIEVATVKNHVHHLLEKLKVRRRAEAAAALREGHAAL